LKGIQIIITYGRAKPNEVNVVSNPNERKIIFYTYYSF